MEIKIIKESISLKKLKEMANQGFGDLIKAVIEQEIMAIGGELYADEEVKLSEECISKHENMWGINIYPKNIKEERIEFDSMINIKPELGNRSRGIGDESIRKNILEIVKKLIK